MQRIALTVFQGRAGDHNNLSIPGAKSLGEMLSNRLRIPYQVIGIPEPALCADWKVELVAAMPALRLMAAKFDSILAFGQLPLTASSRCAVSLSTLPMVARHRPDACVVWFDAHADLNTPDNTTSGYLGGLALSGPAGLWDSGLGGGLKLSNIILVGQRDLDPPEQALVDSGQVRLIPPYPNLAVELREAISGRPVYVHLDCDVLDAGIVPTDYRHENGLQLKELLVACTVLAAGEVIGFEIAEFENAWQEGGSPVSPAGLLDAVQPLIDRMLRQGDVS
jgi:arginase family enzyme